MERKSIIREKIKAKSKVNTGISWQYKETTLFG